MAPADDAKESRDLLSLTRKRSGDEPKSRTYNRQISPRMLDYSYEDAETRRQRDSNQIHRRATKDLGVPSGVPARSSGGMNVGASMPKPSAPPRIPEDEDRSKNWILPPAVGGESGTSSTPSPWESLFDKHDPISAYQGLVESQGPESNRGADTESDLEGADMTPNDILQSEQELNDMVQQRIEQRLRTLSENSFSPVIGESAFVDENPVGFEGSLTGTIGAMQDGSTSQDGQQRPDGGSGILSGRMGSGTESRPSATGATGLWMTAPGAASAGSLGGQAIVIGRGSPLTGAGLRTGSWAMAPDRSMGTDSGNGLSSALGSSVRQPASQGFGFEAFQPAGVGGGQGFQPATVDRDRTFGLPRFDATANQGAFSIDSRPDSQTPWNAGSLNLRNASDLLLGTRRTSGPGPGENRRSGLDFGTGAGSTPSGHTDFRGGVPDNRFRILMK